MTNHQTRLEQAQKAVQKASEKVQNTPYRLGYHIMAPAHWINDPNGLIQWAGEYHVFYQHHPYSPKGGPIHWGHVKSKDLVFWEHMPIALAPGEDYDRSGCFSGSAVDNNGKLTLIYTGHVNLDVEKDEFVEYQCLAESSDGVHFKKHPSNPIISEPPKDGSPHFRDPKVWKRNDKWYMVLGNQVNNLGNVVLYESKDLIDWEYQGVIAKSTGKMGYMFECPDFFELNGKHILLFSPQGMELEGDLYQSLYQNGYYVGGFNYETKEFNHGDFVELDKGFDFYAGQTFLDDKGRRIVIGWMSMWESVMPEQEHGWAGAMTIPRELKLNENNHLVMMPVEELKILRGEHLTLSATVISENIRLDHIKGECLEIVTEYSLKGCTAQKFGINIRCSEDCTEKTMIYYDTHSGKVTVDRNQSGKGEGGIRRSEIHGQDHESIKLHLFIDRSSLELFVNGGETVITSRIYPNPSSVYVELFAEEGEVQLLNLDSWKLADIWK
ncbi:glycoside hydrolase family 32 protein [Metabacillus rhizolycopersici]|uniref:Sucrose-6-phosphate hydrolase n=1 Tax=Metabacillus rhizolycopersici TaxID=2875709 RepID=A0ABS7UY13_9BACI|nr:sucrose-6-phosphate hydrolase [Metabacillus rhizolycopersici]MBZ5753124.1 sucrose-6-phosphate hydrolase [Metabacillus rhizolycopersici]